MNIARALRLELLCFKLQKVRLKRSSFMNTSKVLGHFMQHYSRILFKYIYIIESSCDTWRNESLFISYRTHTTFTSSMLFSSNSCINWVLISVMIVDKPFLWIISNGRGIILSSNKNNICIYDRVNSKDQLVRYFPIISLNNCFKSNEHKNASKVKHFRQ